MSERARARAGRDDPLSRWFGWVLAGLLPSAVHRLNNARAVVLGMAELLAGGGDPGRREHYLDNARTEAGREQALLNQLALLAKAPRSGVGVVDAVELIRRAAIPLDLLAHADGGSVETMAPPSAPTRADGALLEALMIAVGATLQLCGCEGRGATLSLRLSSVDGALRWSAGLDRAVDEASLVGAGFPDLDALTGCVEIAADGWAQVAWTKSDAAIELTLTLSGELLPETDAGGASEAATGAAAPSTRVTLVMADPLLADLVVAVLQDAGHAVRHVSDTRPALAELEGADLVLWDEAPSGRDDAFRAIESGGTTLAFLAGGVHRDASRPTLGKPFRPKELVAFVADVLRGSHAAD